MNAKDTLTQWLAEGDIEGTLRGLDIVLGNQKMKQYDPLVLQQNRYNTLTNSHLNGDISHANYLLGLDKIRPDVQSLVNWLANHWSAEGLDDLRPSHPDKQKLKTRKNMNQTSTSKKTRKKKPVQVFLEYSHFDSEKARRVREYLQQAGFEVVCDQNDHSQMFDIEVWIADKIRKSDFVVIIVSKYSLQSSWVAYALRLIIEDPDVNTLQKLIPVRLDSVLFDSNFPTEAGRMLQKRLFEEKGILEERKGDNIGIGYEDLTSKIDRIEAHRMYLTRIINRLQKTLVFNIEGQEFEYGMTQVIERIRVIAKLPVQTVTAPPVILVTQSKSKTRDTLEPNPLLDEVPIPHGTNYLLTIAIDHYADRLLLNLDNCANDARDFATVLVERYGFIRMESIIDRDATENNIQDLLERAAQIITPEDNLIILYSGHGVLYPERNVGAWLPYDTEVRVLENNRKKYKNDLLNPTIVSLLMPIRSRHTVLISDSCFSGSLLHKHKAGLDTVYAKPTRVVLTSGQRDQKVADSTNGSTNSPFARNLIKTLRQNQKSPFGMIELWNTIREKMSAEGLKQVPNFGALDLEAHDSEGEFFFFLNKPAASGGPATSLKKDSSPPQPDTPEPKAPEEAHTTPTPVSADIYDQIRGLVSAANTEGALILLAQQNSEAILLQARFNNGKKQHNMGLIDFDEWQRIQNQVNYAILSLAEK